MAKEFNRQCLVWQKECRCTVPILPDFLYLSSCFACTRQNLLASGIKHVVRLGCFIHYSRSKVMSSATLYINELTIDKSNSMIFAYLTLIRNVLEETGKLIDEIHRNGERVLVHCHVGVSRSSSVVLAYLMQFRQMSLYDSWNLTYKVRPHCSRSRLTICFRRGPSFDQTMDSRENYRRLKWICLGKIKPRSIPSG